jgi:hypothetical protein
MYDEELLGELLAGAGVTAVQRCRFREGGCRTSTCSTTARAAS